MSSLRDEGAPVMSLNEYLRYAKEYLRDAIANEKHITLVMGNDNADVDSITSSVVFGYLRTREPPAGAWSDVYIPLLQVDRETLSARADLQEVLQESGISTSELVTLDNLMREDEPSRTGLTKERTRMFLVNNNKLLGRMEQDYSQNILGAIDNNNDEDYVPRNTDPEPRIIGKSAGSCTSLVVNWGSQPWASIPTGSAANHAQLATFALAGILTKTRGLQSELITEEDKRAVRFLESKGAHIGQPAPAAAPVVAAAPVAASSGSTYTDLPVILSQGFAQYGVLGLSESIVPLQGLVDQSQRDIAHYAAAEASAHGVTTGGDVLKGSPFTSAVRKFAQHFGLAVYAIVTREKELFVWVLDPAHAYVLPKFLSLYGQALQLGTWGDAENAMVKEAGMYNGMMKVFYVQNPAAGAQEVVGALGNSMQT